MASKADTLSSFPTMSDQRLKLHSFSLSMPPSIKKSPMKKPHLFSTFFLLVALPMAVIAQAEPRTFSSPDGRTVQAEILGANAETVTLKLTSGQTITAALTNFIPADQAFIKAWTKANPTAINYSFSASYTKEKKNSFEAKSGGVITITDTWVCKMKIANRSGQPLEGVTIDYEIYYNFLGRGQKEPILRKETGSVPLPALKNFEETEVLTKDIQLKTNKLEGGYYWAGGARARQKDALVDMSLQFVHNGQKVFRWASQGVPEPTTVTRDASKPGQR